MLTDPFLPSRLRAFQVRFDWLLFLHLDPLFDPFRGDERFDALVGRIREASTWTAE